MHPRASLSHGAAADAVTQHAQPCVVSTPPPIQLLHACQASAGVEHRQDCADAVTRRREAGFGCPAAPARPTPAASLPASEAPGCPGGSTGALMARMSSSHPAHRGGGCTASHNKPEQLAAAAPARLHHTAGCTRVQGGTSTPALEVTIARHTVHRAQHHPQASIFIRTRLQHVTGPHPPPARAPPWTRERSWPRSRGLQPHTATFPSRNRPPTR